MSCEGNRHKFIAHLIAVAGGPEATGVTGELLERLFWASRKPAAELSPTERLAAEAKTRKLFVAIEAAGFKPPTHATDGMPKVDARPGYAALYDQLKALGLLTPGQPILAQVQMATVQQQPDTDPPEKGSYTRLRAQRRRDRFHGPKPRVRRNATT